MPLTFAQRRALQAIADGHRQAPAIRGQWRIGFIRARVSTINRLFAMRLITWVDSGARVALTSAGQRKLAVLAA